MPHHSGEPPPGLGNLGGDARVGASEIDADPLDLAVGVHVLEAVDDAGQGLARRGADAEGPVRAGEQGAGARGGEGGDSSIYKRSWNSAVSWRLRLSLCIRRSKLGAVPSVELADPDRLARLCTWRIVRQPDSKGAEARSFGSAVVVHGGWLSAALTGRSLVFTCAHVCSAGRAANERPRSLAPEEAAVDFCDGERSAGPLMVRRVVWESPREELDAALLEVDELPAWSREAAAEMSNHPARRASSGERIAMRGYLMNQSAQLARTDVQTIAVRSPYLYYDVETGRGLSGAPIFSSGGELIGLHRGESKVLPAALALASRHGVGIEEILRAARQAVSPAG